MASPQLPTDGARVAMGFCWITMGAHAAALARHRTKGDRDERYGPPGRTLGALSPALFSVEKTKRTRPFPALGKSLAYMDVFSCLPSRVFPGEKNSPVSYTHLTLPTKRIV